MLEDNKTKLRLEIDKTIQTQQYEPIKIIVDIEETFCWKDEKDREKKMESYTKKITEDFISTFNHVVKKIGEEERCIGKVITSGDTPVKGKEKVVSSDEEWDLD